VARVRRPCARLGQAFADAASHRSKIGLLLFNCSDTRNLPRGAQDAAWSFNINFRYVARSSRICSKRRLRGLVYHSSLGDVVREVVPGLRCEAAVEVDDGDGGWEKAHAYEIWSRRPRQHGLPRQPDDYHLMLHGAHGAAEGVICHVAPWSTGSRDVCANVLVPGDPCR